MEEKEELIIEEEKLKKKSKVGKIIGTIIFWLIIAVLTYLVYIGYADFKKIQNNEEPTHYNTTKTYEKNGKSYNIYTYYIYKIVQVKSDNTTTSSFKLWFLDDGE